MRRNLGALNTELYNAVSNWNDFTESDTGERILTEAQVDVMALAAYQMMVKDMQREGLV